MPKKTKLIEVPQSNNDYKGLSFDRWDSMLARFLQDRSDREKSPLPTKKIREKENNDKQQ